MMTTTAWQDSDTSDSMSQSDIESRLQEYNRFHDGTKLRLQVHQESSVLQFSGLLRISWGVRTPIHFQKLDETSINREDSETTINRAWRRSVGNLPTEDRVNQTPLSNRNTISLDSSLDSSRSLDNSFDSIGSNGANDTVITDTQGLTNGDITKSAESVDPFLEPETLHTEDHSMAFRYNTIGGGTSHLRRRPRVNRKARRRLSMINGHLYDLETSVFTPMEGSITTVHVSSTDPTTSVIPLLLHKFKVENNPEEFCLCAVKKSGEVRVLTPEDYPLVRRVLLGPLEDEARLWLRDKSRVKPVSDQVAQYLGLPEPMLIQFLQKLEEDEILEKQAIIYRYARLRKQIESLLKEQETPEWNMD